MLKDHEKFYAFCLLGAGVFALAMMAYFHQIPEGSGSQRIVDAAMGGLLLALGGAANALFRTGGTAERAEIGQAAVQAIRDSNTPMDVNVTNKPNEPVPVDEN